MSRERIQIIMRGINNPLINKKLVMVGIIANLRKLNSKLKTTNRLYFVLVVTSATFIIGFILSRVFGQLREKDIALLNFPDKETSLVFLFFSSVVFAPMIETFLNQSLPYYLLNKIKYLRERRCLILLISALFFGILHTYSLFYIIFGFLLGIIFMYGYMVRINSDSKTFYLIAISHSLFNLGVFIIKLSSP